MSGPTGAAAAGGGPAMDFGLDEAQQALVDATVRILADRCTLSRLGEADASDTWYDLELWRRLDRFTGTGLADCLDYDRIHRWLVETWPQRPHTELLEQLAEELLDKCFEDPRVDWCRVRIRKPEAHGGRGVPEILVTRRRLEAG